MFKMSDAIDQLSDALAKAQAEMPVANKEAKGHYGSYANLAKCVETARPYLSKNGLSIAQPVYTRDGINYLMTIMTHKSGQYMLSEFVLAPNKAGRDALASDVTYWRRINFKSMVGLVDDNEIDCENEPRITIEQSNAIKKVINDSFKDNKAKLQWLLDGYGITKLEDMYAADLENALEVITLEIKKNNG